MNETNLLRTVLLSLTKYVKNCRVFRNNTGTAWQGRAEWQGRNKLILHDPRPLQAGLCPGSSDLIGWTTVKITTEMVGMDIAVFTAVETKSGKGRTSAEQAVFLKNVRAAGGLAYIVRSDEEAVANLQKSLIEQLNSK